MPATSVSSCKQHSSPPCVKGTASSKLVDLRSRLPSPVQCAVASLYSFLFAQCCPWKRRAVFNPAPQSAWPAAARLTICAVFLHQLLELLHSIWTILLVLLLLQSLLGAEESQ